MTILVTGAAGFIGYHLAARLLSEGRQVIGVDNLNSYYDPRLKRARLERLAAYPHSSSWRPIWRSARPQKAVFAQGPVPGCGPSGGAGRRAALARESARVYRGQCHGISARARRLPPRQEIGRLIYASSSSVYAGNRKTPFAVGDPVETPVSLYAATKRAGELMAHCYSHLFGIATTGLRFFTVYGPWGRPDMAPFKFVQAIERGQRIDLYNYGRMQRDFTYVDDIVEGWSG